MEPEERVWEILLSADKKDYERICAEFGITDFRGMLTKLKEMKKEREDEIAEVGFLCIYSPSIPHFMTNISDSFLQFIFSFSLSRISAH